jgi:DNA-binding MarR family transcriptional regulator
MTELDHDANLLGALALAVSDRTSAAMADAVGLSETAATALSALHHFLDLPTIDRLGRTLGLTSSGTVRLVDKLAQAGYVQRKQGDDGRSTQIMLTAAGADAAQRVAAARAQVLNTLVRKLSDQQRAALDDLAGTLLVGMMFAPGPLEWNCRQCDTVTCQDTASGCPVRNELMARHSRPATD